MRNFIPPKSRQKMDMKFIVRYTSRGAVMNASCIVGDISWDVG